jgi:hypothetical protein
MPKEDPPGAAPGVAQDLSGPKSNFASRITTLAADILTLAQRCDEAAAVYFAGGFNSGGANPIVQDDIVGENSHLAVSTITGVITAAQAITTATPQGTRDNLRKAMRTPDF